MQGRQLFEQISYVWITEPCICVCVHTEENFVYSLFKCITEVNLKHQNKTFQLKRNGTDIIVNNTKRVTHTWLGL